LNEELENSFGSQECQLSGPIMLLPQIFNNGCVTTNFDYVLNRVFDDQGHKFIHDIYGANLIDAPRRMADNGHCLLRLHGEAQSTNGRVLTTDEYNNAYQNEHTLHDVLNNLIGTRNMLFLGCSLTTDRTLSALTELKQNAAVQNPRHYAFLPVPDDDAKAARRRELEQADIHPIWYPNDGDHDQHIEDLLITLMEGGLDG
jgi:hypothetical protein